jgi:branched-chain amino acid transport system ATP-binding protein
MLRLINVNGYYGLLHVLKNVSLHVGRGEIVALLGANGAGKTTLLRTISGLHPISGGEIVYDGRNVSGMRAERLVRLGISQVPEGRQIFRPMTVRENLEVAGNMIYRKEGRSRLKSAIEEMFALFPILLTRKDQYAGTLSGGEQQMLTLAMAFICRPTLLLMDEPSMGLAPLIVREIFEVISKRKKETDLTVLLVEQNANAALSIADRGYVMETGKIIFEESAAGLRKNQDVRRAYLGREQREIWE